VKMKNSETGVLVVKRTSHEDLKMRDLYVRIDDLPEDTLLYGESLEVPLAPGPHHIKITNRLYSKSADFEVKAGENVRFNVANIENRGILNALMTMTGSFSYKVRLERG